jgi:hypothetical protein
MHFEPNLILMREIFFLIFHLPDNLQWRNPRGFITFIERPFKKVSGRKKRKEKERNEKERKEKKRKEKKHPRKIFYARCHQKPLDIKFRGEMLREYIDENFFLSKRLFFQRIKRLLFWKYYSNFRSQYSLSNRF